jgi:branched-chain amino acid transport system substrate-binding protein
MARYQIATVLAFVVLAAAPMARADTIKVGAPLVLSGPASNVGQTALRGLQMALDDINGGGGLLGQKIELVTADDAGQPATANTVTRAMILSDGVKALFPGSNSAAAVAEEVLAGQYRIPALFYSAADISLTTTNFNRYSFQLSASTYMDPRAVAQHLAKLKARRVFTLTPDYNFGRSYVTNFLDGMKETGVEPEVVGQQYPALGTTDFSSYISAALAAKPDFLFLGLFAGDLVTFIRQAKGYGLFDQLKAGAPNATDVVETLKGDAPAGMYLWARAPFFAMEAPGVRALAERYKKQFGEWPPEWPIVAYAAVEAWAQGVRKAGSFDGEKVAAALSGMKVATIRGDLTLRSCDHQADAVMYIGQVAAAVDPQYGFPTLVNTATIEATRTMMSCEAATALQRK